MIRHIGRRSPARDPDAAGRLHHHLHHRSGRAGGSRGGGAGRLRVRGRGRGAAGADGSQRAALEAVPDLPRRSHPRRSRPLPDLPEAGQRADRVRPAVHPGADRRRDSDRARARYSNRRAHRDSPQHRHGLCRPDALAPWALVSVVLSRHLAHVLFRGEAGSLPCRRVGAVFRAGPQPALSGAPRADARADRDGIHRAHDPLGRA